MLAAQNANSGSHDTDVNLQAAKRYRGVISSYMDGGGSEDSHII